jgi:Icc-related predicted phosphoesterase
MKRLGEGSRLLRLFFATDLHGSEVVFRKWLNSAKHYGADVLVMGGDLTGKMLVPVVEELDGTATARFEGGVTRLTTPEETAELERRLRNRGYYVQRMTQDEKRAIQTPQQVEDLFARHIGETLSHWVELGDERLPGQDVPAFWMPGNDDLQLVDDYVNRSSAITNADGKVLEVDGFSMLSLGNANITPWNCPRDVTEEVLAEKIDRLAELVPDMSRCIFNIHGPPWGTNLDLAPELDEDFKPRMDADGVRMKAVGSTAVLEAIRKYQPLLALHGHIHECARGIKIGRTLCINTGSEYQEGVLRGALVMLDVKKGVRNFALTAG